MEIEAHHAPPYRYKKGTAVGAYWPTMIFSYTLTYDNPLLAADNAS